MKCTNCKKELIIPAKAYMSLECYEPGGSVIVASECCNTGYVVKMNISYTVNKYEGEKREDGWGTELNNN